MKIRKIKMNEKKQTGRTRKVVRKVHEHSRGGSITVARSLRLDPCGEDARRQPRREDNRPRQTPNANNAKKGPHGGA